MKSSVPLFVASLTIVGAAAALPSHQSAKMEIVFGRDVMPILGQKCFKCHGPDAATVAAGLRLDSFDTAKEVLHPGSPEKSILIERVSAKDPADRMPPADSGTNPLTAEQIETLRAWIAQGAKYERHWAFVPPVKPALPPVRDSKWGRNPIDHFILAKLEANGLRPEREADRDTLALRAAQTLTGLPPTQSELAAFRADKRPDAYELYVDLLMAKPAYGEHQARYWLDAVRYGDTHGLQLDNERGIYPYRDWVVRAFNEDLPFDKFTTYQLAGDLLPKPTTDQLVATGYVRMNLTSAEGGAIEEEFLARNTFDRIETTSTVFLGMTMQCARCHDHKYDPIKQRDYYGLYAFFNSTADKPLDGNETLPAPTIKAATPDQANRLEKIEARMRKLRDSVDLRKAAEVVDRLAVEPPKTRDWQISPVYERKTFDEAFDAKEAPETGKIDWKPVDLAIDRDLTNIIGKPNASVYVKGVAEFPKPTSYTFGVSSDDGIKIWLNGKLIHSYKIGRGLTMGIDEVRADFKAGANELLIKIVNVTNPDGLNLKLYDWDAKRMKDALLAMKKEPAKKKVFSTLYLEAGPSSPMAKEYRELAKEKKAIEAAIPSSLIAQELPTPRPAFILKRGQYDQKGDPVDRHVPPALGDLPKGSRVDRLGFAQWLTAPSNPVVFRVFVNRAWQQHFGIALVKTAEDFGTQGEWPLDQPLLDYLAVAFRDMGGSFKKLNRLIVTSAAFRQSSRISPAKLVKDPENRMVSRGPRYRLDAEVIRDKALFASGLLLEQLGGRGFKPYQPDGIWENASDPASATHFYFRDKDKSIYRRSMYLFWKRTAPPPMMTNLDAPLRDTCVVRRSTTNTPLQALTLQNETAFLEASRLMAERVLREKQDARRFAVAFQLALARPPRKNEIDILTKALAAYRAKYKADALAAKKMLAIGDSPQNGTLPAAERAAWMIVCSTLMNTDEFLTQH